MTTPLLQTLLERYGPVKTRFERDDAADYPWLFERYWEADFDLELEVASVRSLEGELDLELNAVVLDRRDGDAAVGAFHRVIRGSTAWHKSSLTFEPFQRRGIARRVLAASVALYDTIGVDRIRMNAVGVGRYAWARAGFDFDERVVGDGTVQPAAIARLSQLAERLGYELDPTASAWEIANRSEEVPPGLYESTGGSTKFLGSPTDCEGPLGKVLFLCAGVGDWDGTLELTPGSTGRERLEGYCLR